VLRPLLPAGGKEESLLPFKKGGREDLFEERSDSDHLKRWKGRVRERSPFYNGKATFRFSRKRRRAFPGDKEEDVLVVLKLRRGKRYWTLNKPSPRSVYQGKKDHANRLNREERGGEKKKPSNSKGEKGDVTGGRNSGHISCKNRRRPYSYDPMTKKGTQSSPIPASHLLLYLGRDLIQGRTKI